MRNIFKTFKENKRLSEENKILKAQYESLLEFKKNFDSYYHDISDVKIIERSYDNKVVLNGTLTLDTENSYCPTDICKERIVHEISRKLMPFVEFDVIDNEAYGTKDLIGRLFVLTR